MSHGHFGLPSLRLAIGSGVALLLHLLLPYGYVQYRGPAAPAGEVITRGEATRFRDLASDELLATNASPDVALAGLVIAAVAAGLTLYLGFQPLQVGAARLIGSVGAVVTIVGLGLAWMSSMYAVGTGFAAFLGTIIPTEFRAYFWAISPVVIAAGSGWLMWQAVQVATRVVSTADGLRDEASQSLRMTLAGFVLMGVVLVVPWSIGLLPDGASDALGTELRFDDHGPFWFSAEDVQSVTVAESAWRMRFADDFGFLSAAIHMFMALSWTAAVAGLLRAFSGAVVSAGGSEAWLRGMRFTSLAVGLALAGAFVLYVLSWIFFAPPETDQTFLPGFWPILVLAPMLWMVRRLVPEMGDLLRPRATPVLAE